MVPDYDETTPKKCPSCGRTLCPQHEVKIEEPHTYIITRCGQCGQPVDIIELPTIHKKYLLE